MPTTVHLTGFEYQVLDTSGGGIIGSAQTGANVVTFDTTTFKNGAAAAKIAIAVAASQQASNIFPTVTSQARVASGWWFRYSANPSPEIQIREFSLGGSVFGQVRLDVSGDLYVAWSGGTVQVNSSKVTCNVNTWYWVAVNIDNTTTSVTAKLRVYAETDTTTPISTVTASVTSTVTGVLVSAGRWGAVNSTTGTVALNMWFDDFITGLPTDNDDFYAPHKVIQILPGSDGTHSFTNNDFLTGDSGAGGTARANTYPDFNLMVKDATWSTTRSTSDNVCQGVIRTTGYAEIINAVTSETGNATAVRALLEYSSTTAVANTAGCIIRNSAGTATVVFGDLPTAQGGNNGALADYSESTNFFKGVIVTSPGTWTPTEVNALRWRIGGSGDVTPFPTWQGLMVEAAYPIVTATFTPKRKALIKSDSVNRSYRW